METFANTCKEALLWGRDHHGGWFICKDYLPQQECIVYSYGLGADWSFDVAAERYGCEVHGFDPTNLLWAQGMHGRDYQGIDYAHQYPSEKKIFHNWGLGAADRAVYPPGSVPQEWPGLGDPQLSKSNPEPWEMKSIENTLNDLGHIDKSISILKIDVEGAEWDALVALLSSEKMIAKIKQGFIRQMLLEYHWDPDSRLRNQRHAEILEKIRSLGFSPWKVNRHEGSECCLDVSYAWISEKTH